MISPRTLYLWNLVEFMPRRLHDHQEGGESHQVLVREQYTQGALFSDKIVSIKRMFDIIIHVVSYYVAHTVLLAKYF